MHGKTAAYRDGSADLPLANGVANCSRAAGGGPVSARGSPLPASGCRRADADRICPAHDHPAHGPRQAADDPGARSGAHSRIAARRTARCDRASRAVVARHRLLFPSAGLAGESSAERIARGCLRRSNRGRVGRPAARLWSGNRQGRGTDEWPHSQHVVGHRRIGQPGQTAARAGFSIRVFPWAVASPGRRLLLLLLAAVVLPVAARPGESGNRGASKPTAAAAEPATPENPKCYVTGLVFEEQTRMPIAGAKVRVLVESEQDPDKRLLQGVSDATGRYRIEVPLGFVRLSVHPKPGYWSADARNLTSLVTSPDKPTLTHDIPVRRGIAWPVQLVVEGGNPDPADFQISVTEVDDEATRAAWLRSENVSFMKSPNSWHSAARRRRHRRAYPVRRNRKAGHHTWRRGNPGHCG